MNKNLIIVFAAVCSVAIASCGTPSDYRPDQKVSTEYVEPGTRNTFNITDAGSPEITEDAVQGLGPDVEDEGMLNHDPGANSLIKGDSIDEEAEYNEAEAVTNP
ncbi:hypothetical protein CLV24_103170 [Pontibacter ummariensis]|uniref:Secreted protein n=1 Tax=Pontibacter ummariensis TaxID=1610492 RepID=A0A239CNR7_9BACT|nr:hypothetical protein [Pontibacter ummariensis]PRY14931.1 hypothetical protein CLV24_103170 [Pontibacter ummariensis]SNS21321.1 hypothetical protein SAMN06296052_103143 [Pontibacter ummariensis]